jgi:hypothetical protein
MCGICAVAVAALHACVRSCCCCVLVEGLRSTCVQVSGGWATVCDGCCGSIATSYCTACMPSTLLMTSSGRTTLYTRLCGDMSGLGSLEDGLAGCCRFIAHLCMRPCELPHDLPCLQCTPCAPYVITCSILCLPWLSTNVCRQGAAGAVWHLAALKHFNACAASFTPGTTLPCHLFCRSGCCGSCPASPSLTTWPSSDTHADACALFSTPRT